MNSRRLIAALGLAAFLTAPAWANTDTARQMLDQGDFEAAIAELEPLAYGGDVAAMTMLGDPGFPR